ncbi:hypothetical protein RJT34_30185 [Clitoria ternatea]|uniref:Protein tweety homolog n=1 Tax=Clitoria ternatea TaxID=43366 RepID=A0AAN9EU19_CLITE
MVISRGTTCGVAYMIVIILVFLQKNAAQEVPHNGSATNSMPKHIRQEDNTIRVDPFDNFRKYKGGFNITNKHYWSSVVFTGVYGYAIGVLWLLCGLMYGIIFTMINFCCQSDGGRKVKKIISCNCKGCDPSPIPLAILFMILAMTASGLVVAGNAKFYYHVRTSINIIIKTANEALEIIDNATRALEDVQDDLVGSNIDVGVYEYLNSTAGKFDNAAENIVEEIGMNMDTVNKVFKVDFVIIIVIIGLNLIAATILSVFGVLKFWKAIYMFIVLCWLITMMCWLLFGIYYFLENFSTDTCTALYNFEEDPHNSSLGSILPCDEFLSAKSIMHEIAEGITNLVNEVNSNKGGLFPNIYVCNPFSASPEYLYKPENCPPKTIQIGDIPEALEPYTCFDDNEEKCGEGDILNSSEYDVIVSAINSIQNLLNMYPSIERLLECQMVKDAFSLVLLKHCKPLKKFARMAWIGIMFLAIIMVFLVVLWTLKANRGHSYNLSNGVMQPHSTNENV